MRGRSRDVEDGVAHQPVPKEAGVVVRVGVVVFATQKAVASTYEALAAESGVVVARQRAKGVGVPQRTDKRIRGVLLAGVPCRGNLSHPNLGLRRLGHLHIVHGPGACPALVKKGQSGDLVHKIGIEPIAHLF